MRGYIGNNILVKFAMFLKWLIYLTFPSRLSLLDRCYFGDKEALKEFIQALQLPLKEGLYSGENAVLFEKAFGNIINIKETNNGK